MAHRVDRRRPDTVRRELKTVSGHSSEIESIRRAKNDRATKTRIRRTVTGNRVRNLSRLGVAFNYESIQFEKATAQSESMRSRRSEICRIAQ